MWTSSVPHLKVQVIQPASTVWLDADTVNSPSLPTSKESKVKFFKQIFMLDTNMDWHTRNAQLRNSKIPCYKHFTGYDKLPT